MEKPILWRRIRRPKAERRIAAWRSSSAPQNEALVRCIPFESGSVANHDADRGRVPGDPCPGDLDTVPLGCPAESDGGPLRAGTALVRPGLGSGTHHQLRNESGSSGVYRPDLIRTR